MRKFAIAGLVLAHPGTDSAGFGSSTMKVEIPGNPGRSFAIERGDLDQLAKPDSDAMRFEQALLFARAGRRIRRRSWSEMPFGSLVVHDGELQWELDAVMGVLLPGDDLTGSDWIVSP